MITDRTLPDVVRPAPDALLELVYYGFLARYPERTRKLYAIHLRHWFEWLAGIGIEPLAAQRAHIETWARMLEERQGLKASSVRAKLNAVCGLYKFAAVDGHIERNPAAYVRRPRVDFVSTTNGLSRPQIADILTAAEKEGPHTYALICLLALNGLRIGELLASDVEALGHERGYRTIHLPNRKGGKVSTLSLAVRTAWAVDQMLAGRQTGPLFLGRDGQRLRAGAVRRTLRRLCKRVGIAKRITPHGLRHGFVTMALDAGVSERDLMDSTGHSSSAMIRYYDRHRGSVERNATHAVAAFIGTAS